jgi:hypothetical protein
MVGPVFAAPPADGALYSTTPGTGKEDFQRQTSVMVDFESAWIIF